jgi:hypothetical protein
MDGSINVGTVVEMVEYGAERRIIEQSSVPIAVLSDRGHGKGWRQAAARYDVVERQFVVEDRCRNIRSALSSNSLHSGRIGYLWR